jgi:hypothetical protein
LASEFWYNIEEGASAMSDKTSKEKEQEIINLFNENGNISKTAKTVGIHRGTVRRILKETGLSVEKKRLSKTSIKEKYCFKCKEIKSILKFKKYNRKNKICFHEKCNDCVKIIEDELKYIKKDNRHKIDPIFILRYFIFSYLNDRNIDLSIYFKCNFRKLKDRLEQFFEPWMNWNNLGQYVPKEWNDNDVSTHKWNIASIFIKEDCEKFLNINNLFPYSAKFDFLIQERKPLRIKELMEKYSDENIEKVKKYYLLGWGRKRIGKYLNIIESNVRTMIGVLNIMGVIRKDFGIIASEKHCNMCKNILPLDHFRFRGIKSNGKKKYEASCLICIKEYNRKRSKEKFKKLIQDPRYRLKRTVSYSIWEAIISDKDSEDLIEFLDYSFTQLRNNIESKFENWMTWENYGKYNKDNWNDNDNATWKWNIDHIIPQSDLPYTSENDINFKKCWSLENLRPYSAKQNMLDGVKRIRHKP